MKASEVNLFLQRGTMFYATSRSVTSPTPHFFIVLNKKSYEQTGIVVSVVTSQIENRKKLAARYGFPASTIVTLPRGCHPCLTKDSAVDCNFVTVVSFKEMCGFGAKDFRTPDFPHEYLQRIIQGVLESPKVSDEIKAMIA